MVEPPPRRNDRPDHRLKAAQPRLSSARFSSQPTHEFRWARGSYGWPLGVGGAVAGWRGGGLESAVGRSCQALGCLIKLLVSPGSRGPVRGVPAGLGVAPGFLVFNGRVRWDGGRWGLPSPSLPRACRFDWYVQNG
jgi:hypothetical protein